VLFDFGIAAGLTSTKEPEASGMVNGALSPQECGALFPYRPATGELRDAADLLLGEVESAWAQRDPAQPLASLAAVTLAKTRIAAHLVLVNSRGAQDRYVCPRRTGIHPDIRFEDASDPQEPTVYVDVTQAHECNHSRTPAAVAHFIKVAQHARQPVGNAPSKVTPAVRRAESAKLLKYAELIRIAGLHRSVGTQAPSFQPFVVTPEGVLGPGAATIVELLVSTFAKNAKRAPPRLDAIPASHLIGDFRRRLRSAIACAAARGFGKTLNRAAANAFGARASVAAG
jgi:hypothetical protein